MRDDELTKKLTAAIEKADDLNQEAGQMLEEAVKAAMADSELVDDFRYKCALRMVKSYHQRLNIMAQYHITLMRKRRIAAKKNPGENPA